MTHPPRVHTTVVNPVRQARTTCCPRSLNRDDVMELSSESATGPVKLPAVGRVLLVHFFCPGAARGALRL